MDKSQFDRLVESGVLDQILDTSYDGFTYTDETGTIAYVNRAYCEMTGFSEESILGRNIFELIQIGRPLARMSIKVFETRQPITELVRYQADTNQEIMVTVLPFYEKGTDTFRGIVANLRDMTDLTGLRRELELSYLRYDEVVKQHEEASQKLHQRLEELQVMLKDCDIVGESRQMRGLAELAYRIGSVQSTVLITGESGVGKDVFCRMVHKFSGPDKPFIKISCGATPDNLLESELFGYEAGAFTGANKHGKPGIFELGDGGTVFLDEIGELDLDLQVKLLRVLESREFERVGGREIIPLRAGIIASTNQNLLAMSERRAFRADLYYRLSTIELYLPPLRARPEDIPLLIDRLCAQKGGRLRLTHQAMEYLQRYTWPGNVRQLKNLVGRWLVFYDGVQITGRHVVDELTIGQRSYNEAFGVTDPLAGTASPSGPASAPPPTLADQERAALEQALAYAGGNRALAARLLGISRTALYQKLERFRLS